MESSGDSRSATVTLCPVKIQQEYRPPAPNEILKLGNFRLVAVISHGLQLIIISMLRVVADQISVQVDHMSLWMDFRPFLDSAPYIILDTASMTRAFRCVKSSYWHLLLAIIMPKSCTLSVIYAGCFEL